MTSKGDSPSNNNARWTKSDRKALKVMVKEGKTISEISESLGRTIGAVVYQKGCMGLTKVKHMKVKTKSGKKVEIDVPSEIGVVDTRHSAKEMTSVARGIARANGKRITMAMFFVEDL